MQWSVKYQRWISEQIIIKADQDNFAFNFFPVLWSSYLEKVKLLGFVVLEK